MSVKVLVSRLSWSSTAFHSKLFCLLPVDYFQINPWNNIKIVSLSPSWLVNTDGWVFIVLLLWVFMWARVWVLIYSTASALPWICSQQNNSLNHSRATHFCNALIWHSSEWYSYFSCVIRVDLISLFKYYLCAFTISCVFFSHFESVFL